MTEACENAILTHLSSSPDATINDTFPWSESQNLAHGQVVGVLKSLMADEYVVANDLTTSFYTLSKEAESILKNGAQEMIVLKALVEKGKMSMPDLQAAVGKDIAKIGMGNCMKSKWVKKEGADLVPLKTLEEVEDEVLKALEVLVAGKFATDAIDDKVRGSLL
jgi:phenylalanyl-tRNA synthetase alpha chain